MKKKLLLHIATGLLVLATGVPQRANADANDYKESAEFKTLRDSVFRSFNEADSARFYKHVKVLQDYLLRQGDLHYYYTQRCNEIVFELNRLHVMEAYKLATQLSKELTERKLDKEMYMAVNMMGHIYRYSCEKENAKRCFREVIRRMEQEGYTESIPPIYMNLANIYMGENPDSALILIDQAAELARQASPERLFDIETRRALVYYTMGDKERFMQGYQAYKDGQAQGLSSVHGRKMEIFYLAMLGKTDEAVQLTIESADDPYETQADIYANAGRWEEAYQALKRGAHETDSVNSVILAGSMQGIQQELQRYEENRQAGRRWIYALTAIAALLALLVVALVYIVQSRRRHIRQMQAAYQRVLESDKVKTSFIQNVSHEVRTPLNIISGFGQVLADESYHISQEERKHISGMVMHNARQITAMIDEVLEMANIDSLNVDAGAQVACNEALRRVVADFCKEMDLAADDIVVETTLADDRQVVGLQKTLQRIVSPLLDNAVKNRGEGPIVVRAAEENGRVAISVEDHGPGVPPAEAEHIFERFVKLDTFKAGMGLGLTYSRTMARRLGGDVVLDTSYAGPGARFKVVI